MMTHTMRPLLQQSTCRQPNMPVATGTVQTCCIVTREKMTWRLTGEAGLQGLLRAIQPLGAGGCSTVVEVEYRSPAGRQRYAFKLVPVSFLLLRTHARLHKTSSSRRLQQHVVDSGWPLLPQVLLACTAACLRHREQSCTRIRSTLPCD